MTTNNVFWRQAVRAAVKIHEHLLGPARRVQELALPQSAWEDLCRTAQRYRYVERKGWHAAGQSLARDLDYAARYLQQHVDLLRHGLAARSRPNQIVSAREIAFDLMALEDEFEQVEIDLKTHALKVHTAAIELEGIYLGPIRIVLSWQRIGTSNAYRCYAEEPCHPEDRQDVTHPHVLDNQLCEGDGAAAIKAALGAGRLFDFFVLVRQILETYNPESAHVQLSDWNGGYSCEGCGSSMSEDEYTLCDRCSERFCDSCSWLCEACETSVCSHCSDYCGQCSQRFCRECLETPAGTTLVLCKKCLEAQHKDHKDLSDDTPNDALAQAPATLSSAAAAAAPAADSLRLGQAAVSARPGRNGSRRVRRQPPRRPAARRRRATRAASVHARDG